MARGHAVRQLYMLTAMADAAADTGDQGLTAACERLFDNITRKQMYITGAVDSTAHHEAFTVDDDLPSDRCYGETCASVAMTFFAHSMLAIRPDGRYADLMELELYNAVLAGMSLDGRRFFCVNPLTVDTGVSGSVPGYEHVLPRRPAWHACACCPPNLARLIASLGKYLWSEDDSAVYSHLLIGSEADTGHGHISLDSGYPWEGRARYTIHDGGSFTLAIHVPHHAAGLCVAINGSAASGTLRDGYVHLTRAWQPGDQVTVTFDMPVRRIHAYPRLRDAAGKVALARGPFIYCVEGADHAAALSSLILPGDAQVRPVLSEQPPWAGLSCCMRRDFISGRPMRCMYPARSPASLTGCCLSLTTHGETGMQAT